jgi:hypothetical protein
MSDAGGRISNEKRLETVSGPGKMTSANPDSGVFFT